MFLTYSTVSSVINSIVTISGEHIITKIWKDVPDSRYLLITKLLGMYAINAGDFGTLGGSRLTR